MTMTAKAASKREEEEEEDNTLPSRQMEAAAEAGGAELFERIPSCLKASNKHRGSGSTPWPRQIPPNAKEKNTNSPRED